jgi:hypothetical protein
VVLRCPVGLFSSVIAYGSNPIGLLIIYNLLSIKIVKYTSHAAGDLSYSDPILLIPRVFKLFYILLIKIYYYDSVQSRKQSHNWRGRLYKSSRPHQFAKKILYQIIELWVETTHTGGVTKLIKHLLVRPTSFKLFYSLLSNSN